MADWSWWTHSRSLEYLCMKCETHHYMGLSEIRMHKQKSWCDRRSSQINFNKRVSCVTATCKITETKSKIVYFYYYANQVHRCFNSHSLHCFNSITHRLSQCKCKCVALIFLIYKISVIFKFFLLANSHEETNTIEIWINYKQNLFSPLKYLGKMSMNQFWLYYLTLKSFYLKETC